MKKVFCCILAVCMVLVLAGCGGQGETVSTNGSTSMEKVIGILSEQFMNAHGDITVTYDATGSGTGIEAVANGTCDIGLASRNLKEEEGAKGLVSTTLAPVSYTHLTLPTKA